MARFNLIISPEYKAKPQLETYESATSAGAKVAKAYRDKHSLGCFANAVKPLWLQAWEMVRD